MTVVEVQKSLSDRALWIERGVLLILILVLAGFLTWDHRDKMRLQNELQAEKLRSSGYVDDINKKQKDLDKLAKTKLDGDEAWRLQVAQMEKLLGEKPQIIRVVEWKTRPEPVYLTPSEPPRQCPNDGKKIVLVEGDELHAELAEIDWGTKANNDIMTGRLKCFRDTPTPLLLHTQLISEKQPEGGGSGTVYVPPLVDKYRWGGGLNLDFQNNGVMGTGKLMFPPAEANLLLFKTQLETEIGLGIGTKGMWQIHFGAGGRFK